MNVQLFLASGGGLLIGLLLTVFGGGGSVLATPWLVYVVGMADIHVAIGTSAAAVTANAATGLYVQSRAGTVKWPCALLFASTGLIGAFAGAWVGRQVDGAILLHWFAFAMIAIAVTMVLPRRNDGDPSVRISPAMAAKLAPVGLLAGFAAGFFGIGGGFLIAPGLMASTGMTLSNASASSLLSVSAFGSATSISYAAGGQIDWLIFGALMVGGVCGALLGLPVSRWLAKRIALARTAFAALVTSVAIYILLN